MASAAEAVRRLRRAWLLLAWPLCAALAVAIALWLQLRFGRAWLSALGAAAPLALAFAWHWHRHERLQALHRALAGTVASYRDGDFAFGLRRPHDQALAELVDVHNALGDVLREQRNALVQRELLLDTVVQHTPVAIVLVDASDRVVLGNLAARRLLGDGRRLEGRAFDDVLARCAPALGEALASGAETLLSLGDDEDDGQIVHVAHRVLRLNGRPHRLVLLRELTSELRRREVQTWKKVIRVISHELNNGLAPIASLAHSGAQMLKAGRAERAEESLSLIAERSRHLEEFIRGYARFARLPAPRREALDWDDFIRGLQQQVAFDREKNRSCVVLRADPAQLEQALLNLLRNAHESGGPADAVQLALERAPDGRGWRIDVLDRGAGMSEAVMTQALLPFYSTKRGGTGLGLALAREIAEAHGGSVQLARREDGGMRVSLLLPD